MALHVRLDVLKAPGQAPHAKFGCEPCCAGLVTDFEEKPSAERMQQLEGVSKNATSEDPFEASMGIYMFKRDVLTKLLDRHSAGNDTKPDAHFGYDVIPHALEDGLRIMAHHHPGYWRVSSFHTPLCPT